jgi:osmoprotectant transport system permease protein
VGSDVIARAPFWNGPQLSGNWNVIWFYVGEHVRYTAAALGLGLAITVPLVYLAHRWPRTYAPVLVVANVVYAVPALTMFIVLGSFLGLLNDKPVVLAMALYTLVILVRNFVEGLRAVPRDVVDAASGLGLTPARRFVAIEVPLALPGIVAGMRLAAISTISLISVAGVLGRGALGGMMEEGFSRRINTEIAASFIAIVVLALVADALILLAGQLCTPWVRAQRSDGR